MNIAVPQATVSWEAAHAAVEAAVRHAESLGVRINVGVTDVGGNLIAFLRMPGAFPQSIQFAIDKAYTAGGFGFPTAQWMSVFGDNEGMKLGFSAQLSIKRTVLDFLGMAPEDGATDAASAQA